MMSESNTPALDWVFEKLARGPDLAAPRRPKSNKPPASIPLVTIEPIQKTTLKSVKKTKDEIKAELGATKLNELELWKRWRQGGEKKEDLDPLLKSLDRLIQNRAGIYKGKVEIPNAAIDFEHKQRVVDALRSYNPAKGSLATWITRTMMKADRFIKTNQNFARITEPIANKIGKFNSAKAELSEKLGHEPDAITLAEHTGFSLKEVKRLNKEQRKGLISSGFGVDTTQGVFETDRLEEVKLLILPLLTPQERIVHEYTCGLNGRPRVEKSGELAKILKWDVSKVSKMKTSIMNKMAPHLG